MKNLTIVLLFTCLTAAFASCQKVDIAPVDPQTPGISNGIPAKNIASPVSTPDPIMGNVNNNSALAGTWKIVNDSTHYDGGEVAANATSANYVGKTDDYFAFSGSGKLYIKEKGVIDTANYTIDANNSVVFNYLYYNNAPVSKYGSVVANFKAINLSNSTVTLSSKVVTTQGIFSRVINLTK